MGCACSKLGSFSHLATYLPLQGFQSVTLGRIVMYYTVLYTIHIHHMWMWPWVDTVIQSSIQLGQIASFYYVTRLYFKLTKQTSGVWHRVNAASVRLC